MRIYLLTRVINEIYFIHILPLSLVKHPSNSLTSRDARDFLLVKLIPSRDHTFVLKRSHQTIGYLYAEKELTIPRRCGKESTSSRIYDYPARMWRSVFRPRSYASRARPSRRWIKTYSGERGEVVDRRPDIELIFSVCVSRSAGRTIYLFTFSYFVSLARVSHCLTFCHVWTLVKGANAFDTTACTRLRA